MIRDVSRRVMLVLAALAMLSAVAGCERYIEGRLFEVSVEAGDGIIIVRPLDEAMRIMGPGDIELRVTPFVLTVSDQGSDRCVADGGNADFVIEDSSRLYFSHSSDSLIVSDGRDFRVSCGVPPRSPCTHLYFAFSADYKRETFLWWINDEMILPERIEVCRQQPNATGQAQWG